VKLCNGKLVTITACEKGFYSSSRPSIHSHSLVTLLSRLSKAFADVCVPPSLYPSKPEFLVSEVILCIYIVLYSFAFEEYSFLHLIIRRDECKAFSSVALNVNIYIYLPINSIKKIQ
jgi:hypothetical protein